MIGRASATAALPVRCWSRLSSAPSTRQVGPRVHPLCPIICGGELYLLVVPGTEVQRPLSGDAPLVLHSFPLPRRRGRRLPHRHAAQPVDDGAPGAPRPFVESSIPRRAIWRSRYDPKSLAEQGAVPPRHRPLPDHHHDRARRSRTAPRDLARRRLRAGRHESTNGLRSTTEQADAGARRSASATTAPEVDADRALPPAAPGGRRR